MNFELKDKTAKNRKLRHEFAFYFYNRKRLWAFLCKIVQ